MDQILGNGFRSNFPSGGAEHSIVKKILDSRFKIQDSRLNEIKEYAQKALKKTDQKRKVDEKTKQEYLPEFMP